MILSKEDIENIADGIIKDFREVTGIDTVYTAIDQLASDYLGLDVTFEKISNNSSFCGVTAYDDTNFKVVVDKTVKVIEIKKNQIILDSDFITPGKVRKLCGKRRFTLAHEIAHQILFQLQSEEEKMTLRKMYSTRKAHTLRQLKTTEDWNEWQANALGAALLMPRSSVSLFMATLWESAYSLILSHLYSASVYTEYVIADFCDYFHVSKSSAVIRLKQLNYLSEENLIQKAVSYA